MRQTGATTPMIVVGSYIKLFLDGHELTENNYDVHTTRGRAFPRVV